MSLWEEFVSVQQDRADAGEEPRVPTARGAARPPVPSQAMPPPVSAPPALGSAGLDGPEERIGRHAVNAGRVPGGHPDDSDEGNGHRSLDHKTILLPTFITGRRDEGKAESPRPQAGDKLPPSERGMLVFVAALLALGTVAVVVMLGFGGLTPHHPAAAVQDSATPAPGAPVGDPSPSPSDSQSASPSPSPSPSSKPPTHKPSPSPVRLGTVRTRDLYNYCTTKESRSSPVPPDKSGTSWTCQDDSHPPLAFTPDDVCSYRYSQVAHAMVGTLTDPATWTCYR
jgi:hypothetical protein